MDLDEGGALSAPASGHTRFAANNDGTLRYYPDGGSEQTVADTTHTHTPAESQAGETNITSASLPATYGATARARVNVTPSGAGHALVLVTAAALSNIDLSNAETIYWRLVFNGLQRVEESSSVALNTDITRSMSFTEIEPAASAVDVDGQGKSTGSGNGFLQGASVNFVEIESPVT